ncbi:peptide/nickel transport system substrate-binding protein [Fervidobacterium changbaicum]|uniref:ABC transporter substrate-binding protein n=3 Tax=Fervidobacterium TaxID=2422 RepID=A0AAI8CK95_FERIS|nr:MULTISPECIES: ABC transporter substrate-binding protein [Fervidobacterium]AMW32474.1 ABC transporter substrate-binding protein [Fervidobacterium islandicum]QAV33944.1 ABC transporter substrate-binding protein [Fervidobacterium changbaicum]SDH24246.1 peptide/nickel transport system substrate-binding protein [Fervidobacterium changbaicum]
MKKWLVVLAGLIFAVLALAAFDPTVYVEATIGEPDTLDPHLAYDTASGEVLFNVYENLIAYKGRSVSEFEPRLATEVPTVKNGLIKDGGKTYVFPIRKGVKFHNGNPLTPEDVEYSFERGLLYDPEGGPMWMLWYAIFGVHSRDEALEEFVGKSVDEIFDKSGEPKAEYKQKVIDFYKQVVDPAIEVQGDNVVIKLKRPYGAFLNIIAQSAHWAAILDKETCIKLGLWDGKADTWWKWKDMEKEKSPLYAYAMGTGPYKFVEWDRKQQKVTLVANESYWRTPAKIKKVIIWGIDEWSTRKAMLEKGDADSIAVVLEYLDQLRGNKDIEIIENIPTLSVTVVAFGWSVSPSSKYIGSGKLDGNGIPPDFFSDVYARKAVAAAINYDALIRDVLKGFGKRIPTALPEGLLGFDPTLPLYKFNLQEVQNNLKKAWNGQAWQKGIKFSVAYNQGNMARQRVAEMIKMYMEMAAPGKVKIDVQPLQWPTFLDATKRGELPIFILGWLADFPDPDNFIFTYYHSKGDYSGRQGKKFQEFVSTPRKELGGKSLDELIEQAAAETDPAVRAKLYIQIQKFAIDNCISIPVYQPVGVRVQRKWVKGWYDNPMRPGMDFYSVWKEQ